MRAAAALAVALAAAPALAYLLPPTSILRRMAQRREDLGLHALEARGTFAMSGEAARNASAALGIPLVGSELEVAAVVSLKMPGRCRLELAPADVSEADRPAISIRQGRLGGAKGLDRVPAAAAMAQGLCALLGERPAGGDADRQYADRLARLGVPVAEVHLGRADGRLAYVLGARPTERKPQAWIEKQTFQPIRIVYPRAGSLAEVRLLDFGSPIGGDWFPRAVEVHGPAGLEARFTAEKVVANPKLPDSIF